MISFLKAIEFVLSIHADYSESSETVNETRTTIQLQILKERKKSERRILRSSGKYCDPPKESSKLNGFPLDSDFGWNVNLIKDYDNQKSSTPLTDDGDLSNLIHLNERRRKKNEKIMNRKMNNFINDNNELSQRNLHKKNSQRKALQLVVRHPSWNWTESYLLKALIICAQEDPDASKALSLELAEADDESKWKELGKARTEFLRLAGNISERLRVMKEEVILMRRYAEDAEIEMKKEDLKVKSMQKEVQKLTSEVMEIICADEMLKKLSIMNQTLKLAHYPTNALVKFNENPFLL